MDKQYTIQQFSASTGLTVHTLRYYEKIGLLSNIARDEHGYRYYGENDLLWVQFLLRLRETGMPISDMKRFSDLRSLGSPTINQRREMLESHEERITSQIQELQENLAAIRTKIKHYKSLEGELK